MRGARSVALLTLLATSVTSCVLLEIADKATKVEDEVARARAERDRARGPSELAGRGESSPLLAAAPSPVDFGDWSIGAATMQTVRLTNPAGFPVTVVNMLMTRPEFSIAVTMTPFAVPAHGEVMLTIAFRPLDKGGVSGALQLELDTVAGRIIRIPLKGRGR